MIDRDARAAKAFAAKIRAANERKAAEAEREAARLYESETGDRYQRAIESARYADWRDAGRGDDYDDVDYD